MALVLAREPPTMKNTVTNTKAQSTTFPPKNHHYAEILCILHHVFPKEVELDKDFTIQILFGRATPLWKQSAPNRMAQFIVAPRRISLDSDFTGQSLFCFLEGQSPQWKKSATNRMHTLFGHPEAVSLDSDFTDQFPYKFGKGTPH